MPSKKRARPPGPFVELSKIRRADFQFRNDQWRALAGLLPAKLRELGIPPEYLSESQSATHRPTRALETIADAVIYETEGAVSSHVTTKQINVTGAQVRAAIRRLRQALKPFVSGWVDDETAGIIPPELDGALAAREQELAEVRISSNPLRSLCGSIAEVVRVFAKSYDVEISESAIIRFVDVALTCANINHPDPAKHRDRLADLVFSKAPS